MKKTGEQQAEELEYLVLDEYCRVYKGMEFGGEFIFSENMDDGKPLKGQEKFKYLKDHYHLQVEQMFLEPKNVRKKRRNRKTSISV